MCRLYAHTISYKGLEHLWILVSQGSWNQFPADTEGQFYKWEKMHKNLCIRRCKNVEALFLTAQTKNILTAYQEYKY